MARIQIFNNWSPYLVKDPENTVWIGLEYMCDEKDEIWKMKPEELKVFAVSELNSMNIVKEDQVIDYHVEKVKKAYPAYFGTYSEMDKIREFLNQFENLYCIGRNGQHRYNNMDHSMLTAIETAEHIKNQIQEKDSIWNINTEQSYHEVKKSE